MAMAATGLTARYKPPSFDVLDADMKPADVIEVLESLKFRDADQFRTLKIDGPIRDFLVMALRGKA